MDIPVIDREEVKIFVRVPDPKKRPAVRRSKWVEVQVKGTDVVITPKKEQRQLVIYFDNPHLFREPCTVLHISKPEVVTLPAHHGQQSLYRVFVPDNRRRSVRAIKSNGPGNCTSFVVEDSNPTGPIIVR